MRDAQEERERVVEWLRQMHGNEWFIFKDRTLADLIAPQSARIKPMRDAQQERAATVEWLSARAVEWRDLADAVKDNPRQSDMYDARIYRAVTLENAARDIEAGEHRK
jgi:hypothetical protein